MTIDTTNRIDHGVKWTQTNYGGWYPNEYPTYPCYPTYPYPWIRLCPPTVTTSVNLTITTVPSIGKDGVLELDLPGAERPKAELISYGTKLRISATQKGKEVSHTFDIPVQFRGGTPLVTYNRGVVKVSFALPCDEIIQLEVEEF